MNIEQERANFESANPIPEALFSLNGKYVYRDYPHHISFTYGELWTGWLSKAKFDEDKFADIMPEAFRQADKTTSPAKIEVTIGDPVALAAMYRSAGG